jgi:hypothetical protein
VPADRHLTACGQMPVGTLSPKDPQCIYNALFYLFYPPDLGVRFSWYGLCYSLPPKPATNERLNIDSFAISSFPELR